jgi:hypothetical protein
LYISLRLQAAVLPQFQQKFGLNLGLARIQYLVVGQQLAAVFFLQQRQIVSRTLEQILAAMFLLRQRKIAGRKAEKAQRDSRDRESAASYCRTPAAERKSRDK